MTENKPIYHARNVNWWKGSVQPRPFISLLILDFLRDGWDIWGLQCLKLILVLLFFFGHGVVIYYLQCSMKMFCNRFWKKNV